MECTGDGKALDCRAIQQVVNRAATPGQQIQKHSPDAARAAATGVQIRCDRQISRRGDVAVDRLYVRPVAEYVVNHHLARPRGLEDVAVAPVQRGEELPYRISLA